MSYFMGFYPPSNGVNNISSNEATKAIPPFMLSDLKQVQSQLGSESFDHGYQIIPILTTGQKIPDMFMGAFEIGTCPLFTEAT